MNTTQAAIENTLIVSPGCDADISFRSCDGVVFKIHSKILDTHCGGFPPAEFKSAEEEYVPLTEDGETLEKLFQFIYPRRLPELIDVSFSLLCKIAEAAEKYEVFNAMAICKSRMRYVSSLNRYRKEGSEYIHKSEKVAAHPLQVFIYGYKHGHDELTVKCAPFLHEIPFNEVLDSMPDGLIKPWVRYHSDRRSKLLQTFAMRPQEIAPDSTHYLHDDVLAMGLRYFIQNWPEGSSKAAALAAIIGGLNWKGYGVASSQCITSVHSFDQALDANLAGVSSFTTYLTSSHDMKSFTT